MFTEKKIRILFKFQIKLAFHQWTFVSLIIYKKLSTCELELIKFLK